MAEIIKVHGHPISPPTRRVLACLEEKALPYEFVVVDMAVGAHKKQPFISLNPFGQVPAVQDGDLKLFESRAITQYLARQYADKGTSLIPSDPKKAAVVGVWTEVEAHAFDSVASVLSFEIVVKPLLGMTTDDARVEENSGKLGKILDVYESRLGESKYLGGEEFSLADLHHIPVVANLMGTKIKAVFEARARVAAWAQGILSRPAWQRVVEKAKIN